MHSTARQHLRKSMVYEKSPGATLGLPDAQPSQSKDKYQVRMNTAASEVVLTQENQGSAGGAGSVRGGGSTADTSSMLPGYRMPKLAEQDPRKNINILNWKNYKLPARGKETFLDDVIRSKKKSNVPDCKLESVDWNKEKNSTFIHGIATKDCFYNKSPRVMINDQIMKSEKKRAVPPLGTHKPNYAYVESRIQSLPRSTLQRGALTADAEYQSLQTPGAKYDPVKAEKLTQPKSLFTKIYEKRKDPDQYKFKKSKGPDMGTYDSPRAYDTT